MKDGSGVDLVDMINEYGGEKPPIIMIGGFESGGARGFDTLSGYLPPTSCTPSNGECVHNVL